MSSGWSRLVNIRLANATSDEGHYSHHRILRCVIGIEWDQCLSVGMIGFPAEHRDVGMWTYQVLSRGDFNKRMMRMDSRNSVDTDTACIKIRACQAFLH